MADVGPASSASTAMLVDIHTHMYPPSYIELLKSRSEVPYVRIFADDPTQTPRLIILPSEAESASATARGRPLTDAYTSIAAKLAFMNKHGIAHSVISLANPWLDFVPAAAAAATATETNDALSALCAAHPRRLSAFATLPVSAPVAAITAEIHRLKTLAHIRGVILGTGGLGAGLDDPALAPVWAALAAPPRSLLFLHPHYGIPGRSVYGPRADHYGHVLPLAVGFPVETTLAVLRLWLAGVWDRHPGLEVLLAHTGGVVPFLAGRVESCVAHDAGLVARGAAPAMGLWDCLRRCCYLDAVVYSEVGVRMAAEVVGWERVMWGTDHPFFPPLQQGVELWPSALKNRDVVERAFGTGSEEAVAVLGANAVRVLGLET